MSIACLWFTAPLPDELNISKVAERCLRLSPQICLRKEQALFIEFGKCRRLYSEASFQARAEVILRQLNIQALIGVAHSIPEALLKAKYQCKDPCTHQSLTKEPVNIDTLPLHALLDLADPFDRDPVLQKYILQMIQSFQDLGIRQLQQFRQIPLSELTSRFGAIGVLCSQRVQGQFQLPWPFWKPEEIISEKTEFPYFEFYGELEPLLFALKKQLDSVFQRLFARGLKAQKMEIRIFCEVTSLHPEAFRLFEFDFMFPQSHTKGTLAILQERLTRELQRKPIFTPIEGLETRVVETVLGSVGQKNFLTNHEEITEQLNALLNRLGEVHGRKNIFTAELTEDRRPEYSWQRQSKKTHHKLTTTESRSPTLEGRIPLRPTYLLTPERVQLSGDFIYIRHKRHRILQWSENVERINGGWHESESTNTDSLFDESYARDYYHLKLDSEITIAIFKTPSQEFYLHGYFG